MNLSRLAALAVFFMMIMSTFVTVPTYNVGAMEGGCMDYDDTNENGLYDEGEPCYDDDEGDSPPGEGEGCMDYDDTNGNELYDEGEPCYDDDGSGPEIDYQSVLVEMISLSQWDVNVEGHFSVEESNEMRHMIAEMCDMLVVVPSTPNVISQPCLDAFVEMMNNDSFGDFEPDMCDSFGLTDDQCEGFISCEEGGGLSCMRVMQDLCSDPTSPGPYDICSHWEDSDMMTIIGAMFDYEVLASPTEDQATAFLESIEAIWGDGGHYQPEDIANYDVYHFNINDEEVANYTVDIHGVYNETTGEWFEPTYVYLYEGTLDYPTSDEVPWIEGNDRVCEYVSAVDLSVDCSNSLGGLLEVGAYSMFITNSCNHQWEYNESSDRHDFVGYDCRYGSYNLSIYNDDNGSHVDDIVGEISIDDSEFIFAEVHVSHRHDSEEFAFFPYYDTYNYQLTAGDDTSYFYSVQEAADNQTLMVWLYDGSFDSTQWDENLMYVSSGYENYDDSGGYNYNHSYFNMSEFEPGAYTFVTTGQHTHTNGSYDAGVYAKDDVALASWSGQLDDSDDRAYFTYGHHEYFQNNDHGDDGDDFGKSVFENIEAWRDGSQSAVDVADSIVDIFWAADEAGMFQGGNHCEDGHCDEAGHCDNGHCGGDSHCDDGHCGEEHHCDDGHCNASDGGHCDEDGHCNDDHCNDGHCGDGPDEGDCPFTDQETCEELQYLCNDEDDGGNPVMCGWEVAHYCLENEDSGCDEIVAACASPVSTENASICAAYNDFNHDTFHAEHDGGGGVYLDGIEGEETPHNWDDDKGTLDPENIVGDIMLHDNSSIIMSNEFVLTFDPVDNTLSEHIFEIVDVGDDMGYHCWSEPGMSGYEMRISFDLVNDGTEDCGDGADEPQDMDDDGVNDSWFDCNDPTGTQVNMEKTNDGTEDCPNGADEGVYLGDDPDLNFTFSVLPEYEIVSCTNCSDSVISDDKTTVTFTISNGEDISIVFREVSTQPDCDHVVGVGADYTFNPAELDIMVGETVCWQWENAPDAHNVIEIDVAYDASLNITEIMAGFNSGAVSNSGDFRHTFSEDNQTHYYVCEPHATMGMAGTVTVGAGSEGDRIPEVLEDSGLPNVSFMVGALVLVGAASLRRRIH